MHAALFYEECARHLKEHDIMDPHLPLVLIDLARTKDRLGEYAESMNFFEEALGLYEHSLDRDDDRIASLQYEMGVSKWLHTMSRMVLILLSFSQTFELMVLTFNDFFPSPSLRFWRFKWERETGEKSAFVISSASENPRGTVWMRVWQMHFSFWEVFTGQPKREIWHRTVGIKRCRSLLS